MLACGQSAAGVPLVCVVDHANRRVVVLALPADARALVGRTITLGRDPTGRMLIRPDGLRRGL
jgi:hypothetical protein